MGVRVMCATAVPLASRRGRYGGGSRTYAIGLDMCPGGNVETRIARDPGMPGMLPVRDGHLLDHRVSLLLVCAAAASERHSV